jgi:hypothetical protein
MKRVMIGLIGCMAAIACMAPPAAAQNHVELGAFADYFRLQNTHSNFVGVGARLGVGVHHYVTLEAEMSYDFAQAFTEGFQNTSGGNVGFSQTNLRVLHGLFGPTISTGHGAFRPFVTVKGGFINFRFDPTQAGFSSFTSSVGNLRSSDVNGVLYPGGGFEALLGPIGLRLEVGDEIYFVHGGNHNLRVTFGPVIHF